MNRLIIFLLILFIGNIHAQTEVVFDIDKTIFKDLGDVYMSKDGVMIQAIVSSSELNQLISEAEMKNSTFEELEKGFLEETKIYFIQKVDDKNGEKTLSSLFLKECQKNQIIIFMSFIPIEKKDIYYPMMIKGIKSAKLKE